MSTRIPRGFKLSGVHCGLKRSAAKQDLALVVTDRPAVSAGVYTQNRICAAPVRFDRQRTPNDVTRVIVINSGNANAATGDRGDRDAAEMARLAAAAVGAPAEAALVLSTGIIGEFLPMEKIAGGIHAAAAQLGDNDDDLVAAARGMLTTDTRHKLAGRTLRIAGSEVSITGMAKGAAMIGPRMATMLGVVMTDARLTPADAQTLLGAVVEDTFNCISVDGHMSTNDTVLLVASGAAQTQPLAGDDRAAFHRALHEVCSELARSIPADGEGATHLVTIDVQGCRDREAAYTFAKVVAESPLVKTAIAGADPNWGRIVSAAGYAGVPFDPRGVSLRVNGLLLFEQGAPVEFDRQAVSTSIRENRDTHIDLRFSEGTARIRFWTTDLTAEYVRLNADYHT
ncbi:MAG: bifunctional glutamate N-acetyltransferase/amino-acid acetyltransferase ArgJ [Pirellulales bacterium]|nr:bifunctional glutamate N-acetyltransferase/amino-acid acetyltransferase ArgJ [Pirellulales bacterium]